MTMNLTPIVVLTTIAAIASAAAAGMMYVFSTFVMRGLDRTGPVNAITAMRAINVDANSSAPFLIAYLGTAVLAAALGVAAVVQIGQPGSGWLLAGAIFGVLAAIITIAFNVPLNNHLDTVDPAGPSKSPTPPANGRRTSPRGRRGTTSAPSPRSSRPC